MVSIKKAKTSPNKTNKKKKGGGCKTCAINNKWLKRFQEELDRIVEKNNVTTRRDILNILGHHRYSKLILY